MQAGIETCARSVAKPTNQRNRAKGRFTPRCHRLSRKLCNIRVAKQPYEKISLSRLGVFAVKRFRPPLLHIILKAAMSLDPNFAEFGSVTFLKQAGGPPARN